MNFNFQKMSMLTSYSMMGWLCCWHCWPASQSRGPRQGGSTWRDWAYVTLVQWPATRAHGGSTGTRSSEQDCNIYPYVSVFSPTVKYVTMNNSPRNFKSQPITLVATIYYYFLHQTLLLAFFLLSNCEKLQNLLGNPGQRETIYQAWTENARC